MATVLSTQYSVLLAMVCRAMSAIYRIFVAIVAVVATAQVEQRHNFWAGVTAFSRVERVSTAGMVLELASDVHVSSPRLLHGSRRVWLFVLVGEHGEQNGVPTMTNISSRPGLLAALALWTTVATATPLAAAPPRVTFTASPTVECRDLTPPAFAAANPREKLIEATFRVSLLFGQGGEDQIQEVLIVIDSPQGRLRVADFEPKTESVTDIVGPIERSELNDSTKRLEAGIGGTLGAKYGVASAQVTPSLNAGVTEHDSVKETYKLLPPKKLLLAAGTTAGEHGVFFKLKPSTQASLEGARQFTCLFIVPRGWRGDWLRLTCTATAESRRQFVRKVEECGRTTLDVGLYLEGDVEAKRLARQLDRLQNVASLQGSISLPESLPNELVGDAHGSNADGAADSSPRAMVAGGKKLPPFWHVCRKVFLIDDAAPSTSTPAVASGPTLVETRLALQQLSGYRPAAIESLPVEE